MDFGQKIALIFSFILSNFFPAATATGFWAAGPMGAELFGMGRNSIIPSIHWSMRMYVYPSVQPSTLARPRSPPASLQTSLAGPQTFLAGPHRPPAGYQTSDS